MKHKLTLLAVLLTALAIPQTVKAYDFTAVAPSGQTLYYSYINGDSYRPQVIVTYPEDGTNPGWGSHTKPTGDLIIPNSVTCGNMTYSVDYIREGAFSGCDGLTSVIIPNTITNVTRNAFSNCSGLISISIPNSVTSIGENAFSHCSGLRSVTIPNSVTEIGVSAFGDCSRLSGTLVIPSTVTTIRNSAFGGCKGLASVVIPNSVSSIGSNAFYNVRHIEYRGTASGSPWGAKLMNGVTENGFIFSDATKTQLRSYIGSGGSVSIPNSVTNIASYALYLCGEISSIIIPNTVTSIGTSAFGNCSGLTEITCLGTVAPTVETSTFTGVESTIPINIPCGSAMSYYSRWSYFSNFQEDAGFIFETASADSSMGHVNVLAQPSCQAPTAVIYAVPNEGYHFTNWSDGITENPRSLVVTQDTSIIAYFSSGSNPNGIVNSDEYSQVHNVYADGGKIVVTGAEGEDVCLYDMMGHLLATRLGEGVHGGTPLRFDVPASGVYLVRIGDRAARKVAVVR